MLITHQHPHNKSMMVSVIGKPNAGKSTLINTMLGQDLSIVSPLPQTTRNHFHCTMTIDRTEIVFVDTPGVHRSNKELNLRMNQEAEFSLEGADAALLLVDSNRINEEDFEVFKEVFRNNEFVGPVWLVFTKKDLSESKVQSEQLTHFKEKLKKTIPSLQAKFFWISTVNEDNINELTAALLDNAAPGAHLYPKGDISNKNIRFFVAEYIREQVFYLFKDEVPYEIAVVIDSFKELDPQVANGIIAEISASIIVNRASQRAIVVGAGGKMIKEIGTRARKKIEELIGGKIFLNLHVKVLPKWFNNNLVLEGLGLPRAKLSHRVWRSDS
jgi:GTP-binding protein Era